MAHTALACASSSRSFSCSLVGRYSKFGFLELFFFGVFKLVYLFGCTVVSPLPSSAFNKKHILFIYFFLRRHTLNEKEILKRRADRFRLNRQIRV